MPLDEFVFMEEEKTSFFLSIFQARLIFLKSKSIYQTLYRKFKNGEI